MRYMMLMIPKVYQDAEGRNAGSDFAPSAEAVERMTRYNERLAQAGALIALDGLHPPTKAARVSFRGGATQVTDGPFTESKEVVGGYWLIRAASKEEAVEWARQCPADEGDVIEIRQIFEPADWPEDVREAAESPAVEAALDEQAGRDRSS